MEQQGAASKNRVECRLNAKDADRLLDSLEPWSAVGYAELIADPEGVSVSMEVQGCEPEDVSVRVHARDIDVHVLIGEQPVYHLGLPMAVDAQRGVFTLRNGVLDVYAPLPATGGGAAGTLTSSN